MKKIISVLLLSILILGGCVDKVNEPSDLSKINYSIINQDTIKLHSKQESTAKIRKSVTYKVAGKTYKTLASNEIEDFTQSGKASWYGSRFHGKKTASGEIFSQNKLTAAHTRLPIGTRVEVTNIQNGKKVIVRINDRGPFSGNRIIDLSRAAAKKIGIIKSGVEEVNIRVIN